MTFEDRSAFKFRSIGALEGFSGCRRLVVLWADMLAIAREGSGTRGGPVRCGFTRL